MLVLVYAGILILVRISNTAVLGSIVLGAPLLSLIMALRIRAKVETDGVSIIVRNLVTTRRVEVSQIRAIEDRPFKLGKGEVCPALIVGRERRREGAVLMVAFYGTPPSQAAGRLELVTCRGELPIE